VNLPQSVRRLGELDPAAFYWATLKSTDAPDRQAFVLHAHVESTNVIDTEGEPLEELLDRQFAVLLPQLLEYVAARPLRCLTWASRASGNAELVYHAQIWPNTTTPKGLERQGRSLILAIAAALIACLELHGPVNID